MSSLEIMSYLSLGVNVVFTLLLIFQWDRNHAKEQSVKNNLFGTRRMLVSLIENTETFISQKAKDVIESIDSTLATLDARSPFVEKLQIVLSFVHLKNKTDSAAEIVDRKNEII